MEKLLSFELEGEVHDEIILQQATWRDYQKDVRLGILVGEAKSVVKAKIRANLQEIIKKF